MLGAMSTRRSAARRQTIRRRRAVALAVPVLLAVVVAIVYGQDGGRSRAATGSRARMGLLDTGVGRGPNSRSSASVGGASANLRPGSDPSVLPGPVLIADRDNTRLLEVRPDGRVLWRFPARGDL